MARFTGTEKGALLLAALGREAAAAVLRVLDGDEQERLGQTMFELEETTIEEETLNSVIKEFRDKLLAGGALCTRMGKALEDMFATVHGEEEARVRLERIREESRGRHPFRGLRGIKPQDLARILEDEHPQVQALVLSNLDSDQAAAVLAQFSEEQQVTLVYRMATMEEPSPRLLNQVAHGVLERTRGLTREDSQDPLESDPRLRVVADILNAAGAETDKEILDGIEAKDEDMVVRIKERMFSWDDLTLMDRRTMQKILAGIDTKLLALALKASDDKVKEALLAATSQRTRDMILEERELLGSVPLGDVLDAQKQILGTIRELVDSGEITVSKGKGSVFVE